MSTRSNRHSIGNGLYEVDSSIVAIDAKPITRSFPSGHAAVAVAYTLAGTRVFPGTALIWWPLALLVSVSRIYLGSIGRPMSSEARRLGSAARGSFSAGSSSILIKQQFKSDTGHFRSVYDSLEVIDRF